MWSKRIEASPPAAECFGNSQLFSLGRRLGSVRALDVCVRHLSPGGGGTGGALLSSGHWCSRFNALTCVFSLFVCRKSRRKKNGRNPDTQFWTRMVKKPPLVVLCDLWAACGGTLPPPTRPFVPPPPHVLLLLQPIVSLQAPCPVRRWRRRRRRERLCRCLPTSVARVAKV